MIQQLRVLLPNRPGQLARLLEVLAAADVDLKALEVDEAEGGADGQAHLIVNDLPRAKRALDASGHTYTVQDVLVLEVPDEVGGLSRVLAILSQAGINIHYLYAFVTRVRGKSLAVLTVDDLTKATKLLTSHEVVLVTSQGLNQEEAPPEDRTSLGEHLSLDFFW
ncbi:MAG: ACT domain-containing protein [Planctomycetota bacterium]